MTYEDLKPHAQHRVFFEILPDGGDPINGEGKILALNETQISIATEDGPGVVSPARGVVTVPIGNVVSIRPA